MEKFYFSQLLEVISYINEFYEYNSNINDVSELHRYVNNYKD